MWVPACPGHASGASVCTDVARPVLNADPPWGPGPITQTSPEWTCFHPHFSLLLTLVQGEAASSVPGEPGGAGTQLTSNLMGQGRGPGEGLGRGEPPSLGHRGFLGAGPARLEQPGTQWAWKRTLLGPDAGQELGSRVAAGGFGCGREVMGKGKQRVKSCERDYTLGQGCSGGGSGGESPGQRWVSRASAAVGGT